MVVYYMRKTGFWNFVYYIYISQTLCIQVAQEVGPGRNIQYPSMANGMHTLTTQGSVVQYLVFPYIILLNLDGRCMGVQVCEGRTRASAPGGGSL